MAGAKYWRVEFALHLRLSLTDTLQIIRGWADLLRNLCSHYITVRLQCASWCMDNVGLLYVYHG